MKRIWYYVLWIVLVGVTIAWLYYTLNKQNSWIWIGFLTQQITQGQYQKFYYFGVRELNIQSTTVKTHFTFNNKIDERKPPVISNNRLALSSSLCNTYTNTRKTDCMSLIALYNATYGGSLLRWNWDYCTREWITCNENLTVKNINLFNKKLHGTVPAELSFPTLESLLLNRNYLVWSFPEISAPSMTNIDISFNWFQWSFPIFQQSKKLMIINISSNFFKWALPDYSSLTNLKEFNFAFNMLHWAVNESLNDLLNNYQLKVVSFCGNKLYWWLVCTDIDKKTYGTICCWFETKREKELCNGTSKIWYPQKSMFKINNVQD